MNKCMMVVFLLFLSCLAVFAVFAALWGEYGEALAMAGMFFVTCLVFGMLYEATRGKH